jgi:hypothetical protein
MDCKSKRLRKLLLQIVRNVSDKSPLLGMFVPFRNYICKFLNIKMSGGEGGIRTPDTAFDRITV